MKLLVTEESGRLARWLRLLGHDAATGAATPLAALYQRAVNESRVVVTRNGRVQGGRLVRVIRLERQDLEAQLGQVIRELGLAIDEDLAGDVIPQAELPAVYRAAPARGADGRNSRDADRALDAAERFDRLADDIARQS